MSEYCVLVSVFVRPVILPSVMHSGTLPYEKMHKTSSLLTTTSRKFEIARNEPLCDRIEIQFIFCIDKVDSDT